MAKIVLILALGGVAAPVLGQPADTIVVTATRTAQPLSRIGQSVTVIDADTIRTRQTTVVSDLLRTVPGVTVTRNGGVGGTTSVFIRGAESAQTVALIDGVKLNDPSTPGGGFDFANLLVGNIARIEVLRGPSSILWGSQAIGGVINLITVTPADRLAIDVRAEAGYRGTRQLVGNLSDHIGPLSVSAGGGWFTTKGISAFSEARGARERDGYDNYGATVKLNLTLSDTVSIDARGYLSAGRAGFDGYAPPTYAFGDTADYGRTRDLVGYTGINVALFGGRLRNRLGLAVTDTRRTTYAPGGFTPVTYRGSARNQRIDYQGVVAIAEGSEVTFGVEHEASRFDAVSYGSPGAGRARIDSVYGQVTLTPVMGLTLTGGIRYDDHDRFGGATTRAASGVYSPNGGATQLRASYSEGFKAPALYQLLGDYGNTRLQPERAHGYDVGVTQRALAGRLEASATWFRRDSRDLIDFISCATPLTGICAARPYGTYANVTRARAQGVEVTLALRPVDPLRFQLNYTHLDARNLSVPGNLQLARRPADSVNAAIDYRWAFGLSTGATVTQVGNSFDNLANTQRLPGYVLADVRAAFAVARSVEVYGRVENLFDARYETALLYGNPGRAAYAGVRWLL